MKCKHEQIEITENGAWITVHFREIKDMWAYESMPGPYNTRLDMYCPNCKKKWKYFKRSAPKWVKDFMNEMCMS